MSVCQRIRLLYFTAIFAWRTEPREPTWAVNVDVKWGHKLWWIYIISWGAMLSIYQQDK